MHTQLELPNGASLHYALEGEGDPLVLISGLGGTAGFWRPVMDDLARDYRVLAFDQRGIGGSRHGSEPSTLERLVADTGVLVAELLPERSVTLIGHSTGGVIAQLFAERFPDRVGGMVLSGSWLEADAYMRGLFGLRARLLECCPELYTGFSKVLSYRPQPGQDDLWADLADEQAPMPAALRDIYRARIDALLSFSGSEIAPNLRQPCLVIGSEDDMVVPHYHQRQLAAALPDSVLERIADGGHFFPVSRHGHYTAMVRDWLCGR